MTFIEKIKLKLKDNSLINILKNRYVAYFIVSIIFILTMFYSITAEFTLDKYAFEAGEKSPANIVATRDIEDKNATQRLRDKAEQSLEKIEKFYPTIQIDVKKRIEKFFTSLYEVRGQDLSDYEKLELLKSKNRFELAQDNLKVLIQTDLSEVKSAESYIYDIVYQIMNSGIRPEELEDKKQEVKEYFNSLDEFNKNMKNAGITIVNKSIKANRFVDILTTNEKREQIRNRVDRVIIKRGSIILSEGEVVTPDHISILKDLGKLRSKDETESTLYSGALGLVITILIIIASYINNFNKDILNNQRKMYLLLILYLFMFYISKILFSISPYIGPIGAFVMLVGILIEVRLALIISIFMIILLSFTKGLGMEFVFVNLISAIVALCGIKEANQRSTIFITGCVIGITNVFILLMMGFINHYELSAMMPNLFKSMFNGIVCAVITIGSLPIWEWAFKILTPFKLLELSNPNNKLLKRLLLEAPGTYHHCIIVGNLSEAAAQSIGANSLLARVGAYYHDIGKLRRPYLFKENQLINENPHDRLKPQKSANIITSHIKDGIELAENELPDEIKDIIFQHHGTTLVKYFYFKATQDSNKEVDEADYRYKGEKPKTKEAAIVMLADSVEAAVRSLKEPTEESIRDLINKILEDKLKDGQFDQCNITLRDLNSVIESFMTILMGIFHERIEYPDMDKDKREDN